MAQTGFTPIQIYRSSTASAAPTSGNLVAGELAINTADGKLFYLDNLNAVQVIGWKLVPVSAGGTGLSTYTTGDTLYSSATNTLANLAIGSTGQVLTVASGLPAWSNLPAQVYPGAGIANSTGSAWGTSYGVTGTGSVVLSDSPTLTGTLTTLNLTANGSLQLIGNDNADQNIGTGQFTTVLNIGGLTGFGPINIGPSADGAAINIATTSATSNTVTIGATNGTGNLTFGSSSAIQSVNIGTGTGNSVNIGTGNSSNKTINIGGISATGTITLGRSTAAQTVNIATGATPSGTIKTINIGTGGAAGANTIITIGRTPSGTTSATTIQSRLLTLTGGAAGITISNVISQTTTLVGDLSLIGSKVVGSRAFVTDALAPVFGSVVNGGGSTAVPVYYDGTDWRVG
jgi:hypothetical protein